MLCNKEIHLDTWTTLIITSQQSKVTWIEAVGGVLGDDDG